MKSPYHVLIKPLITEKSQWQNETLNKVAFEVPMDANKIEIKRAVEEIFDVHVEKVNVKVTRGKIKRRLS